MWKSTASTCCRLSHWPIHARICYCNFENLISHPGYEHDSQLNAVDSAVEMTTIQLWKSTASTCCRLSHSPIHACIHYCNFEKLISHPGYKYHAPYRACMSPGNAHKLIRIYMGGLILGINTLYMLSCFLKQFSLVGKGLNVHSKHWASPTLERIFS